MRARWIVLAASVVASFAFAFAGCKSGGSSDATSSGTSTATPTVTTTPDPANVFFYRDVLPIVNEHCMPCHTAGGLSVPLDELATAQAFAPTMASRTASREMPPWPPEPSCGQNYLSARLLPDAGKA